MTQAIASVGTKLQVGLGGSTSVFTDIAEVTNIAGPSVQKPLIEVTALTSTAKEFIGGLADNGDITFDVNYVAGDSTHDELSDLANSTATTSRRFRLVFPNDAVTPKTFEFDAFVSKWEFSAQPNAAIKVSAALKITGAVTQIN